MERERKPLWECLSPPRDEGSRGVCWWSAWYLGESPQLCLASTPASICCVLWAWPLWGSPRGLLDTDTPRQWHSSGRQSREHRQERAPLLPAFWANLWLSASQFWGTERNSKGQWRQPWKSPSLEKKLRVTFFLGVFYTDSNIKLRMSSEL